MTVKSTAQPPDDQKHLLQHVLIDCWVDYRIASKPEMELKKIFEHKEVKGGGLIITEYKENGQQN